MSGIPEGSSLADLLDSRRLFQFVVAAEAPTLAAAAADLFITQQALSSAIRQLERDLGVGLVAYPCVDRAVYPYGIVFVHGLPVRIVIAARRYGPQAAPGGGITLCHHRRLPRPQTSFQGSRMPVLE
ncbi:Putative transcriptional regulator%2C LysR family [Mycobacteroides abscessus]|nr:Putative transcriptional regulator%2C LysR family [Mycobacteroides abscessus]